MSNLEQLSKEVYNAILKKAEKKTGVSFQHPYQTRAKNSASVKSCIKYFSQIFPEEEVEDEIKSYIEWLWLNKRHLFGHSFAFINFQNLLTAYTVFSLKSRKEKEKEREQLDEFINRRTFK